MKRMQINKLFAFSVLLCMLFSLMVAPISAETVDSGTYGDNSTWTLDDNGTLTISGSGDMSDCEQGGSAWFSQRESIKAVII